ncbi:hypothetical protein VOI54_14275 [Tamlana sp. 2201CG12-4]|uniref:hypothetical protein n=1 Tax=Tamlana sp. 2201CG12-4 TaxID=3112582 RepID=UPI002DBE2B35|nr:hypothetical protein [Tamlana sp. 2201CG12-4]MEC3908193.1 hypothetical protein [Tamlana sp. 2201CG12-4]
MEVVKYSDKPSSQSYHYHLLELSNKSKKVQNFTFTNTEVKCETESNTANDLKADKLVGLEKQEKTTSDLVTEFYNETKSKKLNTISVSPNTSFKFYVKITKQMSVETGTLRCSKIGVKLLNGKKAKIKSVMIRTFIPDLNVQGR